MYAQFYAHDCIICMVLILYLEQSEKHVQLSCIELVVLIL